MTTHLKTPKDPDDVDDLVWDWAERLAAGETISTFTATVVLGTWTVSPSTSINGTTTTARVSGGTDGETASVRGRIGTSAGRQLDWTISVAIAAQ